MTAQSHPPVDDPAAPPASPATATARAPRGPLWTGLVGSLVLVIGGFGAGGVLVHDPILTNSALGFWRYGHGREIALALAYLGVALLALCWVRLGREVLAERVGGRAVLKCAAVWMAPMLVAPPLFTRDVYSYLAQGALPLSGFDPYSDGPEVMPGVLADNVHALWQDTPAPYGPLFILLAQGLAWVVIAGGENMILGVLLMRLAMLPGLALLVWALPELTRRLGGRVPVALWIVVANPIMVVQLVGGGHNDLLVVGLLTVAAVLALRGRHAGAVVLGSAAMAIKASAGLALPFLVLVWAARLPGTWPVRTAKAVAAGLAVFGAVFGVLTLAAGHGLGWLPALSAPSLIVNWLSLPTGLGELGHGITSLVTDTDRDPFINTGRALGAVALFGVLGYQWWAAREGGPDAIRRAGVVLLAAALLSPTLLPWYVSWGLALLAASAWSRRGLAVLVFGSLWLMIAYYPDGEVALYNVPYLVVCAGLCLLAAVSLLRTDPLRLCRRSGDPVPRPRPAESAGAAV